MTKDFMEDAQGRQVPLSMVKDIDLLRDQTVRDIMQKTFVMRDELSAFKQRVWDAIQSFLSLSAEQHGVTFGGKRKGIRTEVITGSIYAK